MVPQDPRHRNEMFDRSSVATYLRDYSDMLRDALLSVDATELERACALIEQAAHGSKRIYAIGNGGSAAIADHLCCDWTKGTHAARHPVVDSVSMTANMSLYSAIANDFGFESVFSRQVEYLGQAGDVMVAISSSGNSANIIAGVEAARAIGMTTIGMSGFSGGRLRESADIVLHVAANNYGVVEDAHQALMHVMAQYIVVHRDG